MIPVYVFYSMFGFQRTGDQMWAFGDQLGRGFLLGATAGRTTLNGEGLQHQDGHSLLLAATNPACVAYDPAFGFELRHIMRDALDRMYGERDESVFYYLTLYNEPFPQPAEPEGLDVDGLLSGLYRFRSAAAADRPTEPSRARRSRCSPAARRCSRRSGPRSCWPRTGRRRRPVVGDLLERAAPRRRRLRAAQPAASGRARAGAVRDARRSPEGVPVVAVSDFQRAVPDLIARWVPGDYTSLGTDGYGRSDTRAALRRWFRVDAQSIAIAALEHAGPRGEVPVETVKEAIGPLRVLQRPA